MSRFNYLLLALVFTACAPKTLTPSQASGVPTAGSSVGPVLGATTSPPVASPQLPGSLPQPGSTASATPALSDLPENLAGLRYADGINRFLNAEGQTMRFAVELVDKDGQKIEAEVPLEWFSSRPQDFSVDAQGLLKALVRSGYSEIVVRIPGTRFEARTIINVSGGGSSSGGGGGGGGGPAAPAPAQNTPPVITLLSSSQATVMGAGAVVQLKAQASDAESSLTEDHFSWSCSPQPACGQVSPLGGRQVFWQSPAAAGSYEMIVTVSDGVLSSRRSLTVQVQTGTGTLQINP